MDIKAAIFDFVEIIERRWSDIAPSVQHELCSVLENAKKYLADVDKIKCAKCGGTKYATETSPCGDRETFPCDKCNQPASCNFVEQLRAVLHYGPQIEIVKRMRMLRELEKNTIGEVVKLKKECSHKNTKRHPRQIAEDEAWVECLDCGSHLPDR